MTTEEVQQRCFLLMGRMIMELPHAAGKPNRFAPARFVGIRKA
jgi:hypothetical protein